MRTLEFNVSRQKITKAPGCDFSHLVAGTSGYLRAKFNFSNEDNAWTGCIKAASFWYNGVEHAVLLGADDSCIIPAEALVGRNFYVSVTGLVKGTVSDYQIQTYRFKVIQGVY